MEAQENKFTLYTDNELKDYIYCLEKLPITRILHEDYIKDYQSASEELKNRGLSL